MRITGLARLALGVAAATQPAPAEAAHFSTLYRFAGGADGANPMQTNLIVLGGELYGTTPFGGNTNCGGSGCGTVFKIDKATGAETVLYAFPGGSGTMGGMGAVPSSGLIFYAGLLYGTTFIGGADGNNFGTVFNVSPSTGAESIVYTFPGYPNGDTPSGLVRHGAWLYGTTQLGGNGDVDGPTIFGFNPATGSVSQVDLYIGLPFGPLAFGGGSAFLNSPSDVENRVGAVYKVNIAKRTVAALYSFKGQAGQDGADPTGALLPTPHALYGITGSGGSGPCGGGCGTLFKIDPPTGKETVLHNFADGSDGGESAVGLVEMGGVLYGTLGNGGATGHGAIFEFDTTSGIYKRLYSFAGGTEGAGPEGAMIAKNGVLYGTTAYGGGTGCRGGFGCGTVFKFVP
jgi:uncharacterized repeat protein (TIGR03803 family)